jgi:hypothetical protein
MDFKNARLPELKPLANSFSVDEAEADLTRLFLDLFKNYLATDAFDANVMGAAHLGTLDLVKRMINNDGLVLIEGDREETATRYLYKAWKSRNNQSRGLYFLETYLQMLFPNAVSVYQQAQDKAYPYPTKLIRAQNSDPLTHYWTSRIRVVLDASKAAWDQVDKMHPVLLSIVPARLVLMVSLLSTWSIKPYTGAASIAGGVTTIYPAASTPTNWTERQYVGAASSQISIVTVNPL